MDAERHVIEYNYDKIVDDDDDNNDDDAVSRSQSGDSLVADIDLDVKLKLNDKETEIANTQKIEKIKATKVERENKLNELKFDPRIEYEKRLRKATNYLSKLKEANEFGYYAKYIQNRIQVNNLKIFLIHLEQVLRDITIVNRNFESKTQNLKENTEIIENRLLVLEKCENQKVIEIKEQRDMCQHFIKSLEEHFNVFNVLKYPNEIINKIAKELQLTEQYFSNLIIEERRLILKLLVQATSTQISLKLLGENSVQKFDRLFHEQSFQEIVNMSKNAELKELFEKMTNFSEIYFKIKFSLTDFAGYIDRAMKNLIEIVGTLAKDFVKPQFPILSDYRANEREKLEAQLRNINILAVELSCYSRSLADNKFISNSFKRSFTEACDSLLKDHQSLTFDLEYIKDLMNLFEKISIVIELMFQKVDVNEDEHDKIVADHVAYLRVYFEQKSTDKIQQALNKVVINVMTNYSVKSSNICEQIGPLKAEHYQNLYFANKIREDYKLIFDTIFSMSGKIIFCQRLLKDAKDEVWCDDPGRTERLECLKKSLLDIQGSFSTIFNIRNGLTHSRCNIANMIDFYQKLQNTYS